MLRPAPPSKGKDEHCEEHPQQGTMFKEVHSKNFLTTDFCIVQPPWVPTLATDKA